MRNAIGFFAISIPTLAALLATSASAQGVMRWEQREGEGKIILAYEVPESSDQSLLLVCDTHSRRFSLYYRDDRDRARDGTRTTVEFASEGGQAALPMRAAKQELDDVVVLNVETPLTAKLARIFSGGTLRVTLSGDTERIPLAGAKAGVAALVSGCGVR